MTRQHHHVTLTPQPDKIDKARELVMRCEERVSARREENGPRSWFASYDPERKQFYIEALFDNDAAVAFHQDNIKDIVGAFGALMAARPETVIHQVICTAQPPSN